MRKFLLIVLWLIAIVTLIIASLLLLSLVDYETKTQKRNKIAEDNCAYLYEQADYTDGFVGGVYGKCLHDSGFVCDYGYSKKYTGCCDEDDYSCEICSENQYDCTDFTDQNSAQEVLDMCNHFYDDIYDVHQLDRDGDGIACESLE